MALTRKKIAQHEEKHHVSLELKLNEVIRNQSKQNLKLNLIIQNQNKMAANTDKALADLAAINTQLGKIGTESATLLQKITDLETAVANADTPQSVVDAVEGVKAQAQVVDDLVPDAQPPVDPNA